MDPFGQNILSETSILELVFLDKILNKCLVLGSEQDDWLEGAAYGIVIEVKQNFSGKTFGLAAWSSQAVDPSLRRQSSQHVWGPS